MAHGDVMSALQNDDVAHIDGFGNTFDNGNDDEFEGVTDRELLESIVLDLRRLSAAHDDMVDKVNDIIDNVKPHLDDIAPMIDAIASNPMFRMFTGGRKKGVTP